MKKTFLLLLTAFVACACVDKDYDLSKVDTDQIAIGDQTSVYRIPLATIRIGLSEITESGTGSTATVAELFDNADTWLPTTLPGGATYVDLTRSGDAAYTATLLDALFAEMGTSTTKLNQVTDMIWRDYKGAFASVLGVSAADEATFKSAFKAQYASDAVRSVAGTQLNSYLNGLSVQLPVYRIDHVDIDDEMVDMLADNLGGDNTLHLYGNIQSVLPLALTLSPEFLDTAVRFSTGIQPGSTNGIDEVNINAEDLRTIVGGVDLDLPVRLTKYYPRVGFNSGEESPLLIRLHLIKRGGLQLDL